MGDVPIAARRSLTVLVLLLAAASILPAPADAAITSVNGTQIKKITGAGIDLRTAQQSDIIAFDEKQDVTLEDAVTVEITRCAATYPCTYDDPDELTAAVDAELPAGNSVDSHILHLNTTNADQTRAGCVTFDSDVLGIIAYSGSLTSSEAPNDEAEPAVNRITTDMGKPGVTYPTSTSMPSGYTHRGVEFSTNDTVELKADRRTVCVRFFVTSNIDEIRVLTAGVATLGLTSAYDGAATTRCATATVRTQVDVNAPGAGGDAVDGVNVHFTVTGPNARTGETSTAGGSATYCYEGVEPGRDTIRAFADLDGNEVQDAGEQAVAELAPTASEEQPPTSSPTNEVEPPPALKQPKAEEPPARGKAPWTDEGQKPPFGRECTRTGTKKNDRLVGTNRRDVLCGLGGDDVIIGRGGDDIVFGGRGRDKLSGGAGADLLYGGSSPDVIAGGAGNDRFYGGTGRDKLDGGAGRDIAYLVEKGERHVSVEKRTSLAAARSLGVISSCWAYGDPNGPGQMRSEGPQVYVEGANGDYVYYRKYVFVSSGGQWRKVADSGWSQPGYFPPGVTELGIPQAASLNGSTYVTMAYSIWENRVQRDDFRVTGVVGPLVGSGRTGEYWCR